MSIALALPLLASLVPGATLELDWGARAEARSTASRTEVRTDPRGEFTLTPHVGAEVATPRLRLALEYAPRIWSSDVEERPVPQVNHVATATLRTPEGVPLQARARIGGVRGRTDPVEDARRDQALGAGETQIASQRPIAFEELNGALGFLLDLDGRTAVGAEATGRLSQSVDVSDRPILPPQREVGVRAEGRHLVTERDTLTLEARTSRTVTTAVLGETTADVASGLATWRRSMSPRFDAWAGAGAALVVEDGPEPAAPADLRPLGVLGLALVGDGPVTAELVLRATTLVDRFAGTVLPMYTATGTLRWHARQTLDVVGRIDGGRSGDGSVVLGGADVRAIWAITERLGLEGGVAGRWQRDERPTRPSVVDGGVFVTLVYRARVLFGDAAPPAR